MKAYHMPDWLHRGTDAVMSWALQDIRQGRPVRWHHNAAIKATAVVLRVLLVVGVWGTAP